MDKQTLNQIKQMSKMGMDADSIQSVLQQTNPGITTQQVQEAINKGNQSSFFDNFGIVNTAQASEMMPIEDLRTMPLGTQETFGEKLQPTIPTGGSIFTDRFKNFNQRVGETGIQQVVSPYNFTGFNQDVLDEEEDAQYNLPEKSSIFSNILDAGLTYATGIPFVGKGLEYLGNQFSNTPKYQRYTPGYDYGNLNPNLIDDFYDPATGLNRFDRAKTLFGQSRTLSEYLSKRRERAAAAKAVPPSGDGDSSGGRSQDFFDSQGFGSEGNTVSTDFGSFDLSRD